MFNCTIAKIVNNTEVQFEISVDELDILDIELGQEAKVTIDALQETESTDDSVNEEKKKKKKKDKENEDEKGEEK